MIQHPVKILHLHNAMLNKILTAPITNYRPSRINLYIIYMSDASIKFWYEKIYAKGTYY